MSDKAYTPNLPAVDPVRVSAERMLRPEPLDLHFKGFGAEAFEVLDRLRRHPHIEQYRNEKTRIRSEIQDPFKRYRDDLVVNWVRPNRIGLETEKNVFSRLLKNDFGAGGCHHHFWMSFYRPGRRRLQDVQMAHSLWPEAFYIVVYIGNPIPQMFARVHRRIQNDPRYFLSLLNPLLQDHPTTFQITHNQAARNQSFDGPLKHLPANFEKAKEMAVRLAISRDEVVERGPSLIDLALNSITSLWPLYRYFLDPVVSEG